MVVPCGATYNHPKDPHGRKNAFVAGEDDLGKNAHFLNKVKPFSSDLVSNYLCP